MKTIALIGFGRLGKIHFFNIIKHPQLTLKVIIDIKENHKSIRDYVSNHNISLKTINILTEEQFSKSKAGYCVDLLCITSPTHMHGKHVKLGLSKNTHILCEKPIASSIKEIEECYNLAKKKKKILLCSFNRIFDPYIKSVKDKLNTIGTIHKIVTIGRDYPYPPVDYLKISGGIFHDCAAHDIHYICWMLEKFPKEVMVTGQNINNVSGNIFNLDDVVINMKFENSVLVTIHLSRISNNYDQRIEVYGFQGDIKMNNPYIDPIECNNKMECEFPVIFQNRYAISYKNILNYFYELSITDSWEKELALDKETCVNITKVIDACEKAYLHQKTVIINYNN